MKSFVRTLIIAAAFSAPTLSFAQTDGSANAPAAQAQVAQQATSATSYGGAADTSETGAGHHLFGFLHRDGSHTRSGNDCVGPASYCTLYFGS